MKQKHKRYDEGQWFAVPLRKGGYALGIIVRGNYKTKGGLGYFFGPKYSELPNDQDTWEKYPKEAKLITRFGDLGIINGSWPLIHSTHLFCKDQWPIPRFGAKIPLIPGKGFIREYGQNEKGQLIYIREIIAPENEVLELPVDCAMGYAVVEIRLTEILDE
jgi:hypothetical protein